MVNILKAGFKSKRTEPERVQSFCLLMKNEDDMHSIAIDNYNRLPLKGKIAAANKTGVVIRVAIKTFYERCFTILR